MWCCFRTPTLASIPRRCVAWSGDSDRRRRLPMSRHALAAATPTTRLGRVQLLLAQAAPLALPLLPARGAGEQRLVMDRTVLPGLPAVAARLLRHFARGSVAPGAAAV